MSCLRDSLSRAYEERDLFHSDPDLACYRLFHGYSEGMPGLEIDRYGTTAIITSKGAGSEHFEAAAQWLQELGCFTCVIAKERGRAPKALLGPMATEPQAVTEDSLQYWTEAWASLNPGLYIDARPARRWLRAHCEGLRILNLFSFAGSLGVAAMAGGAASVTHVDTQKRALRRCEDNHRLNNQRIDHRDLVCQDVAQFLKGAAGGKRRFGGIIVDPPPSREDGRQEGELSPIGLSAQVNALLQPGGWSLCFFHHDQRCWDELEAEYIEASGQELEVVWRGRSGTDFPEVDERRALRLSTFQRLV